MLACIVTALVAFSIALIIAANFYEAKLDKLAAAHAAEIKSIEASTKIRCAAAFDKGADTVRQIAIDEITKARMS